jgi:hypothetical protein
VIEKTDLTGDRSAATEGDRGERGESPSKRKGKGIPVEFKESSTKFSFLKEFSI